MPTTSIEDLFVHNRAWAAQMEADRPGFFTGLMSQQKPRYMWIGCSDSRVPANQITSTLPGELFVHRNVANVVVHTDMNLLTVLEYAVTVLKVEHVIVCGHYGCGGVLAAMGQEHYGVIDNWLRHIKDVYRMHKDELDDISNSEERGRRFVELNVIEQVLNVCKTSTIQRAWEETQLPHVHGWVYDLSNGKIKDLDCNIANHTDLINIYKFDF